jgi:hypothetical protein
LIRYHQSSEDYAAQNSNHITVGTVLTSIYLFYLYVCVRNLFGDTDPVLVGLDIFCGATCLGGIALFVGLISEGKPSPLARPSQTLSHAT